MIRRVRVNIRPFDWIDLYARIIILVSGLASTSE